MATSNLFSNPFPQQDKNPSSTNGASDDIDSDRAAERALLHRYGLDAEHSLPHLGTFGHPGTAAVNGVKVRCDFDLSLIHHESHYGRCW